MKKIISILVAVVIIFSVSTISISAWAATPTASKISISRKINLKQFHIIHIMRVVERKEATCKSNGYIKYKCYKCNRTTKTILKSKPHKIVVDSAVPATCTDSGLTQGSHCSVCNAVIEKQKVIAPIGHEIVIDEAIPATCSRTGLTEGSHCQRCHTVLIEQEETGPSEHENIAEELVKATLNSDGYYKEYCADCGETLYYKELIRPAKIKFDLPKYRYTGKKVRGTLNVYDSRNGKIDNTHYSVRYSNNIEVGTATATVIFRNSIDSWYSGEMTATYEIYDPNAEAEEPTKLSTPAIIKAQCGDSKNTIGIYHTIIKGCKTYDVQYATNSSFTNAAKKRITSLDNGSFGKANIPVAVSSGAPKKQVTYYVRIRAVDANSGTVSNWSIAAKVTITINGGYW